MSASSAPLRDYQEKGVCWLKAALANHRGVLLADDPGLGKTRQALTAADEIHAQRILIGCPAGARRVWQNEIAAWFPYWSPRVLVLEPGVKAIDIEPQLGRDQIIVIAGYDEFSNSKSRVVTKLRLLRRWDLLILDEAHYLKNPSNRTQALYGRPGTTLGLQASATKTILLSGTPTPNHAGELWQHYRVFWPTLAQRAVPGQEKRPYTQIEFEDRFTRYRDTVFGRQISGSQNQDELRIALGDVILRRRKSEVLTELPPLILQDISLAPVHAAALHSPAASLLAERLDAGVDLRTLAVDPGVVSLRQQIGLLKVPPAILWVQERMASCDKLLIFAWHHAVIEHLRRGLLEFKPVVITGETGAKARQDAIAAFQTDPDTRIFIGQILAAGTAITLTAASEVAIVEPSWVPGENVQAIGRAHRLGQRDSVLASFLYLPGTLDERIMRVFRRKAAEISQLQGDFDADHRNGRHGNGRGPAPARAAPELSER